MSPLPGRRALQDYGTVAALLVVVLLAYRTFAPGQPDLPSQAPGFHLPDLDGGTLSLESLQGRVVVLNFWATWCGPCAAEIPEFSAFAAAHPEVSVIGVSVDDLSPDALRPLASRLGITYPVVLADGPTQRRWDVSTLPTTIVVGPDGAVWRSHVGTLNREGLERLVVPPPPAKGS